MSGYIWYGISGLVGVGVLAALVLVIRSMRANRRLTKGIELHASQATLAAIRERRQAGDDEGIADLLIRTGAYESAAEIYNKLDRPELAAEAYENAGNVAMAVQSFKRAGQPEQAARAALDRGMHKIAAGEYAALGQYELAAECFEKADDLEGAAEAYARIEKFHDAGTLYSKAGRKKRAAEMFVREFEQALENARGDLEAIAEARKVSLSDAALLAELGYDEEAATLLRRTGYVAEAAKIYLSLGQLERAAECFMAVDLPEEAEPIFEKLGDHEAAARCRIEARLRRGDTIGAASDLADTGDFATAAELLHETGDNIAAAEMFERANQWVAAAELYERESQLERAASLYRKAREHDKAARALTSLGEFEQAAHAWEAAGDLYQAGATLYRAGKRKAALKLLDRVVGPGEQGRQAYALQGRILMQLDRPGIARQKYLEAIGGREVSPETIDFYYRAGRCAESAEAFLEARQHYVEVVAVDPDFADAQARIDALPAKPAPPSGAVMTPIERPRVSIATPFAKDGSTGRDAGASWPVMSRYELLEEIARGGMGVVYRARDRVLKRVVAFKVLSNTLRSNSTAVDYFLGEARAAAAMAHPNIVTVYDAGEEANEYYMAMEFVEGETLKSMVKRRGSFPDKLLRYVTVHTCRGLSYAHNKGLVHRDIKSGNLMLTNDKILKIMDFGLAKFVQQSQQEHTKRIGTPYYMSPEQIVGKDLDRRSDIYSLGITLFECATGKVPFAKGDLSYHHLHTPPVEAKVLNRSMSDIMNGIIVRCLKKRPEDRFQSAEEILEVLKASS